MAAHPRSVLRWVTRGVLPGYRTGGGRWRIRPGDLVRFMTERGMVVPPSLTTSAPRVAVVDDDKEYVAALMEALAYLAPAADIRAAHDGLSAGLLLGTFRPHLLFLDLLMPGIDGFEVLGRLRAVPELDATAVVIVSGNLTAETRGRLLALGAARCLAKPVRDDELASIVAELLPLLPGPRPGDRSAGLSHSARGWSP